jgi:transposase
MQEVTTVGLDIAKQFFQVHGIDRDGQVIVQKKLSRKDVAEWFAKLKPCLVGIESCATSTYWARQIGKLGHTVKLIPPAYVKPYVRRQKNDRNDAEAICEAVTRPSMRFVAIKSEDQQAIQMLHRTRDLLVVQQTQSINALRAHLAELGYAFPQGLAGVGRAIAAVNEKSETLDLPAFPRQVLQSLVKRIEALREEIETLERQMRDWHKANDDSKRLATIPGIGVVTATSLIAAIGDGKQFRNAREFAAWIGLVPRQNSSGGKDKLGGISKRGNVQLRSLLVVGATAMLRGGRREKTPGGAWFRQILARKTPRVATVALANKMARVAWAILVKGTTYRAGHHPIVNEDTSCAIAAA